MSRSYSSIILHCVNRVAGIKSLTDRQRAVLAAATADVKQAEPFWKSQDWAGLRAAKFSFSLSENVGALDGTAAGEAVNAIGRASNSFACGDERGAISFCVEAMDNLGWEIQ